MENVLSVGQGVALAFFPPSKFQRPNLLREAETLINGDGPVHHRPPEENFARTAARCGQFLNVQIEPWQVCVMMADLKIACLIAGAHRDGFLDGAACLFRAGEQA